MRRKYRRGGAPGTGRRLPGKAVLISATVGVLAAGTGISLAATQGGNSSSVTCIVVADADAAADANSALSDVFAVGTALHLSSAGRAVDVTVSGPITAAAATTAPPSSAPPTATASASASAGSGGGRHRTRRHKPRTPSSRPSATASTNAAAAVPRVAIKAAANNGVDPNSVCVKLSKNAFNTLGNVVDGNNVGAFLATMTPTAAAGNATGSTAATSSPATAASSPAATTSSPAATASSRAATGGGRKHRGGRR